MKKTLIAIAFCLAAVGVSACSSDKTPVPVETTTSASPSETPSPTLPTPVLPSVNPEEEVIFAQKFTSQVKEGVPQLQEVDDDVLVLRGKTFCMLFTDAPTKATVAGFVEAFSKEFSVPAMDAQKVAQQAGNTYCSSETAAHADSLLIFTD